MMENPTNRPPRSAFRRRLLLSAGIFILLVLATLGVVTHLIFEDLSQQVINRNLLNSLSEVKKQLSEQGSLEPEEPEVSSDLGDEIPLPAPPPPTSPPQRFRRTVRGIREMVTIRDAGGNVVGRAWKTRILTSVRPIDDEDNAPYHQPREEEWDLGDNKKRKMLTLREPVDPTGRVVAEVAIPKEQLQESLQPLRRSLIKKTLFGAAVTLMLLGCAFAYVLRLMQRTRRLEAEAQMSERRAHVATLAREMAHEIRNPLNAMSMNLEMLEEELSAPAKGEPTETRVFLAGIKGEIHRLKDLAENFLSYARPPRLTLDGKDLNQFLEDLCTFVQPESDARGITLSRDLDPMLPSVDFDTNQLRQAVLNILSNAQLVVPAGGKVMVRTRVGAGGEVRVSITDDGPGMNPEVVEKIFQPFYSEREGGTGLGLPIARRVVEAHGGRIEVESEPGHGTTFHLVLPRHPEPGSEMAEKPAPEWPPASEETDGLRRA